MLWKYNKLNITMNEKEFKVTLWSFRFGWCFRRPISFVFKARSLWVIALTEGMYSNIHRHTERKGMWLHGREKANLSAVSLCDIKGENLIFFQEKMQSTAEKV